MKRFFKKAITPFLPSYEVVCTTYQIIPGLPITKKLTKHAFDKGASKDAKDFFGKVVASDLTRKLAPVEVHLKVAGLTIKKAHFGPVQNLKKKMIAAQS
ncbi:hypothetical protein [Rufibacter sp. LB8]|uniref:hypothetical protein n=1 Tax=Rufibacter sp. LB8 TaxID=2777781 RepID=UPI00178C5281|nr:hypothetical protein [Rufibacter sp. LB8]